MRRLAAMFYDTLLVIALVMLVSATAIALRVGLEGEQAVKSTNTVAVGGILFQLALLISVFTFFYVFWRIRGQTLGMQVWRLRLDNSNDGGRISFKQALIRFLAAILSAVCLGAGYWWIWIDPEKLSWHDRLSGSQLVLLEKS